ncbi:MAG: hypothetical protein H7A46_02305 [Verrucomicrobiales bacterium]|nr:hypothetical protein [Verrucomicrobiales bacterium]
MKPLRCALLGLPVAGLLAFAVHAEEVVFEEPFGDQLKAGWSWIREEPGAWRLRGGALEMRILPGNLWGGANTGRNLLVRPAPDPADGDIEITVKLQSAPTGQYEQINLAWYYDDSHMVKLNREIVNGPVCVVMGREENDQCRTIAQPPVPGGWYRLRLTVSGNRIRGEYWPEGADAWTTAGECTLPVPPNGRPKISIHGYNGLKEGGHWARISEFRVVQRKQ